MAHDHDSRNSLNKGILNGGFGMGVRFQGDVGGISTSDQYSAEAWGTVGYRFGLFGSDNATVLAGYRVLKQKYEDGNGRDRFDWDMTIHGPIAGLKITF